MMIIRSLHEDDSIGKFFIMNLSKDDMLLLRKGLESLDKNPMEFNHKRIQNMIRSFNDPNFVVDNENVHPLYAKQNDEQNGHSFVDLGLPSGLLWATCNVGADSPEQAGLYFAWGETVGFTDEQVSQNERYFFNNRYKAGEIKDNLTLEQDAAHVYMGGKWRMPNKEEFQELIDNCTSTWTDDYNGNGVAGMLLTSKVNGSSIFFPAAGHCKGNHEYEVETDGGYWSSSYDSSYFAWYMDICDVGSAKICFNERYRGFTVRAVCAK